MVLPTATLAVQKMVNSITTIPWSMLKHMEQSLLWSVPPEPTGPTWADDVFTASKGVSLSSAMTPIDDELTDSCSSGVFSSDEDVEWSSDDVSLDGYSDDEDDEVPIVSYAYEGERWYWSPPSSTNSVDSYEDKYETLSKRSVELDEFGLEHGDEQYRRPTMYAMPSIDFHADGVIESWVDRYGSSKSDVTYVATVPNSEEAQPRMLPPHLAGFYIPVL